MPPWEVLALDLLRAALAYPDHVPCATKGCWCRGVDAPVLAWACERLPEAWAPHPFLVVDLPDQVEAAVLETVARAAASPAAAVLRRFVTDAGAEWDDLLLAAASAPVVDGFGHYLHGVASLRSRDGYRLVAVSDLPFPHNPHRCDLYPAFQAILESQRCWRGRLPKLVWPLVPVLRQPAGEQWDRKVGEARHSDCAFHSWDMTAATRGAQEVLRTVSDAHWTEDGVRVAAQRVAPTHLKGVVSLLIDPITWDGGARVSNGQHRICAARHGGTTHLLVAGPA